MFAQISLALKMLIEFLTARTKTAETFKNMLCEDCRRYNNQDQHSVLYPLTIRMKCGTTHSNIFVQRVDVENMIATLTKESEQNLPPAIHVSIFEISSLGYRE